jgi:apolipoprotein N-acyltransferase
MGITPAPINAFYLAWIALIPLWILTGKKSRIRVSFFENKEFLAPILNEKILIPLAWGCGYHGLALSWITGVHPMTWMGVPWLASLAIALFCWLFITFWGAALVIVWSLGMTFIAKFKVKTNAIVRVLIGVAFWCVLESIWSHGSLWWSSLSYTQSPHNLAILQLGQFSGPSTITASIVAVNGIFAELLVFIKEKKNPVNLIFLLFPLAFCLVLHLEGLYLYNRPIETAEKNAIAVGIIQGNIPNEIKLYPAGWRKAIEGYTEGYKELSDRDVDIILTPETALPFVWNDIVANSSFYTAILEKRVPVFLGAFGREGRSLTNSLFTVTGDSKVLSRYDKVNLVPLGEFIPFEETLGRFIDRLSPLDAHLKAGKAEQILNTPFGKAIVGICYDSAFAEHFRRQTARGGEFIVTASNNAHYSPAMPAQHHALDVMRAIETDRWAARATNTGYSAIVDPRGNTLWISGINTYEIHRDMIYRRRSQTLYVKWGDWLTLVLLVLSIIIYLFVSIYKRETLWR